ncbi:P-loop NTPase family protein [Cellulomonas rhizosphaerae]|uniref:ParA family protein n=1 Tax=Cellulomonas rhizosphaerae TaxID=2293719 RepID=A0A413RMF2_9CELL|nr:hypothetical protein [Cellulomonas rhizosphaerae]RHA41654.1 hypothetical protein D1825_08290 [Cellulomonas rhizosphaerae]
MLITLASAKGAPGVTTTARVLASVWPSEVALVDADPAGGDVALWSPAPDGTPLDPDIGLLTLAVEARRGAASLQPHLQTIDGGLQVVCGVQSPGQVAGMGPVWPSLGGILRQHPGTVIADVGRLLPDSPALPLVMDSDALVLVVRPTIEGYAHLRERLRWLTTFDSGMRAMPALGVIALTEPRDTASVRDLELLLGHAGLRVPVLGAVGIDQKSADVVAARIARGIDRSLLVRSARQLVHPVQALGESRQYARGSALTKELR